MIRFFFFNEQYLAESSIWIAMVEEVCFPISNELAFVLQCNKMLSSQDNYQEKSFSFILHTKQTP